MMNLRTRAKRAINTTARTSTIARVHGDHKGENRNHALLKSLINRQRAPLGAKIVDFPRENQDVIARHRTPSPRLDGWNAKRSLRRCLGVPGIFSVTNSDLP
jgi:hypothetical protein